MAGSQAGMCEFDEEKLRASHAHCIFRLALDQDAPRSAKPLRASRRRIDELHLVSNEHAQYFTRAMPLQLDEHGNVTITVDHRDPEVARNWAVESASRRWWRPRFRTAFVEVLRVSTSAPARILELGAGPGLLAKRILEEIDVTEYVLFDFSQAMLDMARVALDDRRDVSYALGDFREHDWAEKLTGPFDAIVSMQAVHEIRHKRHVPGLYARAATLLRSGGVLLVCDGEPSDAQDAIHRELGSTREEQRAAMSSAGLDDVRCHVFEHQYYLLSATKP